MLFLMNAVSDYIKYVTCHIRQSSVYSAEKDLQNCTGFRIAVLY